MPEAVFSNSTRMPGSQDTATKAFPLHSSFPVQAEKLNGSYISDKFEDIVAMLKAMGEMTNSVIDDEATSGSITYGIQLIQSLVIADVQGFASYIKAGLALAEEGRDLGKPFDTDLLNRIISMRIEAYREAGREIPEDASQWSDDDTQDIWDKACSQYVDLVAKLDGCSHLLDAGSMLPWLELKIRREVGLTGGWHEPAIVPDELYADPKNLRDQFIAEKINQGFSLAHVSQALNVKVSAIERTVKRLTETGHAQRIKQAG